MTPGWFVAGALIGLIVASETLLRRAWERSRGPSWPLVALAGSFVFALLVRLAFAPMTVMHEGYHADALDQLLRGWARPSPYGSTGPAIYAAVAQLFGDIPETVFRTNLVLASLTAPMVGLVDYLLFRRWPRATFAACVMALVPVHVRFSASEDLSIPLTLFTTLACATALRWSEDKHASSTIAFACALALAAQSRPEGIFVLGVAGLLVLVHRGLGALRSWRTALLLALVAALLIPHVMALLSPGGRAPLEVRHRPWLLVTRDAAEVPYVISGLATWGLIASLARRRLGFVGWALISAIPFLAFSNLMQLDPPRYNWRSQVILVPILAILAASAFDEALQLSHVLLRKGAVLVVTLAMAIGAALALPGTRTTGDQQEEFAFLRSALTKLPARGRLLVLTESRRELWGALPTTLVREAGGELELIDLGRALDEDVWPTAGDELIYYESMMCHTGSPSSSPDVPINPACAKVREHYELVPVLEHEVVSEPYNSLTYLARPWRIGFYRLRAKG